MSNTSVLAWHFCRSDGNGGAVLFDGTPVVVGKALPTINYLKLCESGYHASLQPIDALKYAPGPLLCRVRCSGTIIEDCKEHDKLVASDRRVLQVLDAGALLQAHARWSAIQCLDAWDAPDAVVRWLRKGHENDRRAAENAAWLAVDDVAWREAWRASKAVAGVSKSKAAWREYRRKEAWRASKRNAAWSAAKSAARSAARSRTSWGYSAARSAVWSAFWGASASEAEVVAAYAAWRASEMGAWRPVSRAAWSAPQNVAWQTAWRESNAMLLALIREARQGVEKWEWTW